MSKKLLAALGTAVLLAGCTLPGMPTDAEGTAMEEASETSAMEAVETSAMEAPVDAMEAPVDAMAAPVDAMAQ